MTDGIKRIVSGADEFYDHLDSCWQCREHPFDLCPKGDILLRQAVFRKVKELNISDRTLLLYPEDWQALLKEAGMETEGK